MEQFKDPIFAAKRILYRIYAKAEPQDEGKGIEIGHVTLDMPFTTSFHGDKKLFFQHQRFEDDLVYRPEWKDIVIPPKKK